MTWYSLVGIGLVLFALGWILGRAWAGREWHELHMRFLDLSTALSARVELQDEAEGDRRLLAQLAELVESPEVDWAAVQLSGADVIIVAAFRAAIRGDWPAFRRDGKRALGLLLGAYVVPVPADGGVDEARRELLSSSEDGRP